ncbi:GPI mannosyltransferase 3 [Zootermopsis nevadensis]|uniref:Mannosyltransferase n=1 Tax=Zootermopsis nevadensis TaxID=136037 RepID=A0A067RPM7_ZOONE|nr:GPI mannosyltransferase 3 [Zootermopsis nevadensis]
MNPWLVLSFFMSIRLCMVYIVQTWFVPDEYWQTVEVAHKIVFGYGHETWEWTLGIRSYIYPAFLATILSVLKYFHLDSVNTVVHGPRILQAVLSAVGDYCFLRWYRNQNGGHGLWASFALITNWFWMYCGSRTLINTFEATLNTFALNLFPWNQNKIQKRYFGLIHQRGTLDVMKVLSDTNHRHTNLLFLMPCHSTPLYSHLHMRIQVRFLTCEPDFTGNPHYQDEADIFYTNPEKWLLQNYSSNDTVSHIIIYDSLYPKIKNFFNQYNYKLNRSLFHTFHPSGRVGKYVEIYTQQY